MRGVRPFSLRESHRHLDARAEIVEKRRVTVREA
jgi:hypothetical protein